MQKASDREDDFLGYQGNRLLQKSQVGLKFPAFFNDFQPKFNPLQRASHDEGETKVVSTLSDGRALEASGGSREALFKSLQVSPHPEFGYWPKIGVYEVQQDLSRIPTGTVRANVDLGPGGDDQFWIRDYSNVLKLVDEIDLGQ